jgi:hypothetical protein
VGFESEVDDILRELLRAPGALAARLAAAGSAEDADGPEARRLALGAGAELVVTIGATTPAVGGSGGLREADGSRLDEAIERAARELAACIRRYGVTSVPDVRLLGRAPRTRAALLRRTEELLGAFAAMHNASCALVLRGPELVAASGPIDAAQRERLSFLRKRVDAAAARRRGKSSHAEIVGDDVYARSFWFDAYLILFFAGPGWSPDFVRHRARAVARELALVLPHLDDDPPAPANIRPLPPRD